MNELGSGIGLEGVLNTVWVKQIVPLCVDPGKCIGSSNSSSQHVPPRPAGRLEVWRVDRSKPEKGGSLGGWGGIRCTEVARPAPGAGRDRGTLEHPKP